MTYTCARCGAMRPRIDMARVSRDDGTTWYYCHPGDSPLGEETCYMRTTWGDAWADGEEAEQ